MLLEWEQPAVTPNTLPGKVSSQEVAELGSPRCRKLLDSKYSRVILIFISHGIKRDQKFYHLALYLVCSSLAFQACTAENVSLS